MYYQSTRNREIKASSTQAVLQGLAPDGGLYVTGALEGFPWKDVLFLPTLEMATRVLQFLLPDFRNMEELVHRAYTDKFETEDLTPVRVAGHDFVLELFRGPTSAFKDVALSMLPQLITAAREQEGVTDKILILTATSGDTGKAALEGFRDVPGTEIIVFYPDGGVSAVQRKQMVSQEGGNVCVCAVEGNFDDTQTGVKEIFAQGIEPGCGVRLSSANSINIGRLAPQVVYYFTAYRQMIELERIDFGTKVDFVVPTGNFGNILAGYIAKQMGLPVGRLICASNCNDVLTEFLATGTYDRRRPFHRTISPSMDILVSSNLERLLWYLCRDEEEVAGYMRDLKEKGYYTVSPQLLEKLHANFAWGCCSEEETKETICQVWRRDGYLLDTHTAVAWKVMKEHQKPGDHMVVLSTASPYKFPTAVLSALGEFPDDDEYQCMYRVNEVSQIPIPHGLATLEKKPELHRHCIPKEEMRNFVMERIGGK